MNCGRHRCELLCHRGKCGRCLQSSECNLRIRSFHFQKIIFDDVLIGFEELYCHCRHSVIHPPVSCGTKPPACDQPCQREHDCEHPPLHTCHSDRTCPPCIVFTDKLCYGGHEVPLQKRYWLSEGLGLVFSARASRENTEFSSKSPSVRLEPSSKERSRPSAPSCSQKSNERR